MITFLLSAELSTMPPLASQAPVRQKTAAVAASQSLSPYELQVDLAELGYLPLAYRARHFVWLSQSVPSWLVRSWKPGAFTVITRGALMTFQSAQSLPVTGTLTPRVAAALAQALVRGERARTPYVYVLVSKRLPETLVVWSPAGVQIQTLANTGVPGAVTADGTFPVYRKLRSQTMRGTNLDGTHYSDPGVPWINYFDGGDAIHGFIRARYGVPQSLGCVELRPGDAEQVWRMVRYGTLVTVTEARLVLVHPAIDSGI